jgi:hypothetical protein
MLLPLLSLVLAAPAPPAPPPKGPAPLVMICKADKDGRPYLQVFVTRATLVTQEIEVVRNGQAEKVQRTVPAYMTEQRQVFLDDPGVAVYGPDGKKVDPKLLRLAPGYAPVLVSADGKEIDPFYLPLARPGTLIVVAPGLAGQRIEDALAPKKSPEGSNHPPPEPE